MGHSPGSRTGGIPYRRGHGQDPWPREPRSMSLGALACSPHPLLHWGPDPVVPPLPAPPRPACASHHIHNPPTDSSLPGSSLSQRGTHTCLSDTCAPMVREGPQPWLYLEEARRHGACCHCIAGGYAPHHRTGGRCSTLQGARHTSVRTGPFCPRVHTSQQAASPTEQGTLAT